MRPGRSAGLHQSLPHPAPALPTKHSSILPGSGALSPPARSTDHCTVRWRCGGSTLIQIYNQSLLAGGEIRAGGSGDITMLRDGFKN